MASLALGMKDPSKPYYINVVNYRTHLITLICSEVNSTNAGGKQIFCEVAFLVRPLWAAEYR
jgi:hypothetical protein